MTRIALVSDHALVRAGLRNSFADEPDFAVVAEGQGGGNGQALQEREWPVLLHLVQGESIGQMAQSLSLSVETISTYRTRVMETMDLASNSDLTYCAFKNGLIQ